jgi:hypothetical protein
MSLRAAARRPLTFTVATVSEIDVDMNRQANDRSGDC